METVINEKISVLAIFDSVKGTTLPYKINWRSRNYKTTTVGFHHKVWQGRTLFHIFSVISDHLFFRLQFNTDSLEWIVQEISDGSTT